jgi:hypothetical protein
MVLAGLISAVIVSPIWIMYPLIGVLWGLALIVYFLAYEKYRNPIGLFLFLFVSASAFEASVGIASRLTGGYQAIAMGAPYVALPSLLFLFTAGSAGAFMVLAAGIFVFGCGGFRWKSLANVLLGSAAGGFLAVLAGFAGDKMPLAARSGPMDFGIATVFLLWQPGVAGILGLVLNADRRPTPSLGAVPDRGISPAHRIAIGAAASLCLLYGIARGAYFELQGHRIQSRRISAYQQYVAETPPATGASVAVFPHPEQLFLPGDISGLIFCPATLQTTPQIFRQRARGFLYQAHYDNDHPAPCSSWVATVEVRDVPDPAWSKFEAMYPIDGQYDSSNLFQPTVKFAQNVLVDQRECYSWPSGHLSIELCYESNPMNEDLLQQFLQKYPSSL